MSGLYTKLISGLIFPVHERMKGNDSLAVRRFLESSQWWDREQLEVLQRERLRALLCDAGLHVPYYRDLFRSLAFDPQDIQSPADLGKLPLLTKALVRANMNDLKRAGARGLSRFNTGGSTGEPLVFWLSKERVSHDVAAKWRATRWWGVDIGDPEIVVWGSPIELGGQDALRGVRDKLLRTTLLPAFEMSKTKVERFLAVIHKKRPKMLFGYPSALSHIGRHAEKIGMRMDNLGIKVAFVTSEKLYDHQRALIQRVFGCRVANGYGGRDAGFIAHECPDGGMHITAEDIVMEIIDDAGNAVPQGAAGQIVITHLATMDFPFIRYPTGDIGVLSDQLCPCGRGLPLLQDIQGRTTDFIVAADGTVMHGLALIYVIRDLQGVTNFKIVQQSMEYTKVLLETDDDFREGDVQTIINGFKQRLGGGVTVEVKRVAEIPAERSGKFRYVVSHVET